MEHQLTGAQTAILLPLVDRQLELQQALAENRAGVAELAGLIAAGAGAGGANPRFERREGAWFLVADEAKGDAEG